MGPSCWCPSHSHEPFPTPPLLSLTHALTPLTQTGEPLPSSSWAPAPPRQPRRTRPRARRWRWWAAASLVRGVGGQRLPLLFFRVEAARRAADSGRSCLPLPQPLPLPPTSHEPLPQPPPRLQATTRRRRRAGWPTACSTAATRARASSPSPPAPRCRRVRQGARVAAGAAGQWAEKWWAGRRCAQAG